MHQLKSPSLLAVHGAKTLAKTTAKRAFLLAAFAASAASAQTYVGSFKVSDGPFWNQPTTPVYSALEAAALIFGGVPSDYAVSINPDTVDPSSITRTAHYDEYGIGACSVQPETDRIDQDPPGYQMPSTHGAARSAYVSDHSCSGVNYVWRIFAPATPDAPVVNDVGNAQLTLSWSAPTSMGFSIVKYTVTGVPNGSCTTEIVPPATEPATSCTISGLTNGTPYKFTVVATNAAGDSAASPESAEAIPSADLTFVGAGPNITLAGGVVATAYSQPLQVTGGLPPYNFSVTGELPPGLALNSATGVISGTPTTPGTYSFSVGVSDTVGSIGVVIKAVHVAEQTFTIVITAAPVVQATPTPVPALGGVGLLLLSGVVAGSMGLMRRRKSN